jgi:hypothetical protein
MCTHQDKIWDNTTNLTLSYEMTLKIKNLVIFSFAMECQPRACSFIPTIEGVRALEWD